MFDCECNLSKTTKSFLKRWSNFIPRNLFIPRNHFSRDWPSQEKLQRFCGNNYIDSVRCIVKLGAYFLPFANRKLNHRSI